MSRDLIKTEDPRYQRDPHTRALVLTDRGAMDEYKAKRLALDKAKAAQEQINILEQRVERVEDKLDLIIKLLTKDAE